MKKKIKVLDRGVDPKAGAADDKCCSTTIKPIR